MDYIYQNALFPVGQGSAVVVDNRLEIVGNAST